MRRSLLPSVIVSSLLLTAAPALAQPAPAARPAAQPAGAQPAAPRPGGAQPAAPRPGGAQPAAPGAAAPGQTAADAPAAPPQPRALEVNDPALAPVPPAKNNLQSWRDAITLMSTRSTELAVAVQEVARAEALSRQAMANVLPSVGASARASYGVDYPLDREVSQLDPDTNEPILTRTLPASSARTSLSADITASQPILAPRAWYGLGTARLAVDVAKLSIDDSRRTVLIAVADGVVNVVTAERVAEINRVGLRTSLELMELTRRRAELGTGTRLDVVRAEQDVANARAQVVSGDESLRKAREALGLAVGSSEAYGVSPSISLNAVEGSLRSICSPGAPDQRADVRAARGQIELAERDVRDAQLAYYPTAEVSASLGISHSIQSPASQTGGQPVVGWSIGALITVPIWEGGARAGGVAVAQAQSAQQRARAEATIRAAQLEQNQAQRSIQVAEQARVIAASARDLAAETARLTRVAFEAGTATSFELVQAGQALRQAELQLALREFDLVKAKISALLASASCRY